MSLRDLLTFTITNPGIYGSLFGTPIINQPQVAIMGVGAIVKRPMVVTAADGSRSREHLQLGDREELVELVRLTEAVERARRRYREVVARRTREEPAEIDTQDAEYIQILDVQGRECSDFQAFSLRALDKGMEREIDPTTTRSLA